MLCIAEAGAYDIVKVHEKKLGKLEQRTDKCTQLWIAQKHGFMRQLFAKLKKVRHSKKKKTNVADPAHEYLHW